VFCLSVLREPIIAAGGGARIMCPDGEGPGFVADKVGVEGADGKMLGPLVFLGNLIPSSVIFVAKDPLPSFLG